jgi:hypothetical protein
MVDGIRSVSTRKSLALSTESVICLERRGNNQGLWRQSALVATLRLRIPLPKPPSPPL